jgi:ABC-type multidrug transport system fused ATPase/permease subunit
MIGSARQLHELLLPQERRRAARVLALMAALALLEATGVASIMPFLAILASPELIDSNPALITLSRWSGIDSADQLLIVAGSLVFILVVSGLVLQALVVWAQVRYAGDLLHSWSCRIVEGYLHRPYEWFLQRHTSQLSAVTINEVNQVIYHAVLPLLIIASNALVVLFVFAFLLIVDPVLALTTLVVLGGAYGLTYHVLRKKLARAGETWVDANQGRHHVLTEAFSGIKEVKVSDAERVFATKFETVCARLRDAMVRSKVMGQVPSFAMQAVVFGGMLLVVLYVLATRDGFAAGLPILGLYAFAGYKMMPALQRIFVQLAEMEFSSVALASLRDPLRKGEQALRRLSASARASEGEKRIRLTRALEFRDLLYRYPGNEQATLKGISLTIPAGAKVGIVGPTGSGKTTMVDVILGLLRPTAGTIVIDGHTLAESELQSWQSSVGYVPQSIFLADTTLAGNIAFGVPLGEIDQERVETVSRLANLHPFVVRELADKYETRSGERGVRLSGGERQRVGIARALYRDPDVIVLDEATSALDNATERLVMEAIETLAPAKTVIMIAHRLSTVKGCDVIFFLEDGEVSAAGTFDELLASHASFRSLTAAETASAPPRER